MELADSLFARDLVRRRRLRIRHSHFPHQRLRRSLRLDLAHLTRQEVNLRVLNPE
jgi:hypothetical protein